MSDWAFDANEALTLSLGTLLNPKSKISDLCLVNSVRAVKDKEVLAREESHEGFNPTFTYPVSNELSTDIGSRN